MLAFSPPLFSTTYGWPLPLVDDLIADNLLQQDINNGVSMQVEANPYHDHSFVDFPTYDQIQLQRDFAPEEETSISSGGAVNGGTGQGQAMMVEKKLNHNASERDRRKRVNHLYTFLRSLLPMSSHDHQKKISIPGTVSLALSYIPQLQKEVETLKHKKEKLLSTRNVTGQEHVGLIGNQSSKQVTIQTKSSVISSVIVLDEKEAVIQLISSSTDHTNKNKEIGFFSKALEYLEEEEDGVVLLNANTFKWHGDNKRFLNTFHFQVLGNHKVEAEKLKEKLCSFYQHLIT